MENVIYDDQLLIQVEERKRKGRMQVKWRSEP